MIEFNDNIFVEKIDEKKDSTIITKKTITFRKPLVIQLNNKNKELTLNCYTDNQCDAEYLEGLVDYEYPIYINVNNTKYGKFYGIIKNVSINREQSGFYEIKLDVERINTDYSFKIISKNHLIENSFIDDANKQSRIMVPTGTKVLYNGITPKTEGLVDIYETDSIELVEPIPTTLIKIYDDMNTTDENKWKLVSKPEEHKFTGNWIIEYGNIRWRSDSKTYIWNGSEWVENGIIGIKYIMYGKLLYLHEQNQKSQPFTIQLNKMKINAYISRCEDNLEAYKHLEFIFENGYIRCNDSDNLDSAYYNGYPSLSKDIINVNSDYIVKTQGYENDNTINSGSIGWVLTYCKNSGIPVICYSRNKNLLFSTINGDMMVSNFYNIPLVNYANKLFNEAENGNIVGGTIVLDNDASNNYVVQETGDILDVSIFDTRNITPKKVSNGQYKVIFRIKANTTSINDKINLTIYKINPDDTIGDAYVIQEITASYIGTNYNYIMLDWDYSDDTYGYKIDIKPNTNVDGTLFNVDYAIIVPISEIENIQKRVFVYNNQKLQIIPK